VALGRSGEHGGTKSGWWGTSPVTRSSQDCLGAHHGQVRGRCQGRRRVEVAGGGTGASGGGMAWRPGAVATMASSVNRAHDTRGWLGLL
jgi:hypothetical protein